MGCVSIGAGASLWEVCPWLPSLLCTASLALSPVKNGILRGMSSLEYVPLTFIRQEKALHSKSLRLIIRDILLELPAFLPKLST